MTLAETISSLRMPLTAGAAVSMGDTAVLLRSARPFAVRGDAKARELCDLLKDVRADGVVTPDESRRIVTLLDTIVTGGPRLEQFVRLIPDFPKPGVLFRDVTGILDTPRAFNLALEEIDRALEGTAFDVVVAPESRGFIFGSAVAARHGTAFVPVRKPGKLPRETISEEYDLEYGKSVLHMHKDAIIEGERAVFIDDLLATGGTAAAAVRLVERLGGRVVKLVFPIELEGFRARANALKGMDVVSLVRYPGK